MPSLVVFMLPAHPSTAYADWDILSIIPHDQHPGAEVAANDPTRFGFVYITDREPSELQEWVAAHLSDTDTSAEGGDVGDYPVLNRKRYGVNGTKIPGPAHKWETYRDYSSNQAIKATFAQAVAYLEDKGAI